MNDDEGTFAAAVAGNACYICGSVVHLPDRDGICPRDKEVEPYVCDYHSDGPGWDMCSADRPCTMDPTYKEVSNRE